MRAAGRAREPARVHRAVAEADQLIEILRPGKLGPAQDGSNGKTDPLQIHPASLADEASTVPVMVRLYQARETDDLDRWVLDLDQPARASHPNLTRIPRTALTYKSPYEGGQSDLSAEARRAKAEACPPIQVVGRRMRAFAHPTRST